MSDYLILTDPLHRDLEKSDGSFEICSDLLFITPKGRYKIPYGYEANGASIPLVFQWLIPKSGKYNRPSIIHDFGYEHGGYYNSNSVFIVFSKKEIDNDYKQLMKSRGVKCWKRNVQYIGLKLGGWLVWNKYRKKNKKIHREMLNKIDKKIDIS